MLLRAVVQVALDAAPLVVGGVDHPGPGLPQLGDLGTQGVLAARRQQRPGQADLAGGEAVRQDAGQQQEDDTDGEAGRKLEAVADQSSQVTASSPGSEPA